MSKNSKVAGRLANYVEFWRSITSDKNILDTIRGFRIPFISFPKQVYIPREINCSQREKSLIDREIDKYLKEGIIEQVSHSNDQFISQIFPRPKKSGGSASF